MTIEASSLRILCVEIYKTINSINEIFIVNIRFIVNIDLYYNMLLQKHTEALLIYN